jgi:hypothetical protein
MIIHAYIMLCISRYTDDTYAQQFGDGRHKFYLEFRCNRPCLKGMDCCAKCAEKSPSTVLQHSRKFNHGNVNEPIPDNSHIYGGKWYYEGVRKWGQPPSEIIEFAIQYQKEARGDFFVQQETIDELSKDQKESNSQEMPRAKKTTADNTEPVKRGRKPKVAVETTSVITETPSEEPSKPVKRTRKPKVAPENDTDNLGETVIDIPKKTTSRKKATPPTPYTNLVSNTNQLVHKEVVLPTHIETKLDKIDTEGFRIEYIKLTVFEANGSTYFRDSRKNKLYKKIKDKGIGAYVGRWNPDTDSIITDIPDSDEEN